MKGVEKLKRIREGLRVSDKGRGRANEIMKMTGDDIHSLG